MSFHDLQIVKRGATFSTLRTERTFNDHLDPPSKHQPTGTNLLDAGQATEMVRYMLEGLPKE